MLDQIRSNFKILFLPKHSFLVHVCIRIKKRHLFLRATIRNTKSCFVTPSPFPVFFFQPVPTQSNIKIMLWKFCICVISMQLYNIYSSVLNNLKILYFKIFIFENSKFWVLGARIKKLKKSEICVLSFNFVSFFCVLLHN